LESTRPLRICYLLPGLGVGGGVNVVFEHANRLLARGHSVRVLSASSENTIDWLPHNRVPVFSVTDASIWPDYLVWNPDILVLTSWNTVYEAKLLGLAAPHVVYFVQSDERRFQRDIRSHLAHLTYREPVHYLTEARWIRDFLHDEFGHHATYARNAINHDIFYPREPMKPKTDRLRILLEGPISIDFKRMNDAFLAVRGLDAEIWCVVSDAIPNDWRYADAFFLRVPHTQMPEIYSSCDVLVKLSAVEGFFGPPLEMMACGGTAVVTRVTGYDEYIVDGENALTVEIGDYQQARRHLQRLIHDRNLLALLKENALKTARQFQWDTTIDIVEKQLKTVASSTDACAPISREQSPETAIASYCYDTLQHGPSSAEHLREARNALGSSSSAVSELLGRQIMMTRGWACTYAEPTGPMRRRFRRKSAEPIPISALEISINGAAPRKPIIENRYDRPDVAAAIHSADSSGRQYGFIAFFEVADPVREVDSVKVSNTNGGSLISHVDICTLVKAYEIKRPVKNQDKFDHLLVISDEPFNEMAFIVDPASDQAVPITISSTPSGGHYVARLYHSSLTDYRFTLQPVVIYLNAKPRMAQWTRLHLHDL